MTALVCPLLQLYLIVLFGRVILSWFPLSPGRRMATIYRFLYMITEPVLGPLRRVIPPIGMLDISVLVAFFAIFALQNALGC